MARQFFPETVRLGASTHRDAAPSRINLDGGDMGDVFYMTSMVRRNFAKRLRAFRILKYDTATEFAEILGIESQRYSKWEQGRAEPAFEMLLTICQHLNCTPGDLLIGPDKSKRRDDTEDFNPIPLRRPKR